MPEDLLRYDLVIENALRDVVRQTMAKVVKDGFPGEHHFYITFATRHPGVEIPGHLMERYPEEMTIVLQHQFFGLKVDEKGFSVMLSFNGVRERLNIPFSSIVTFADPSVNFALQFQTIGTDDEKAEEGDENAAKTVTESAKNEKKGEVISLDMFRKK